ncbi:MAG: tetratricopeptide repeat protein [Acidobacteria bacterium]|nr:tetratricopeptide repeat protein [Acidobacteriota bacterium]
MSGQDKLRYEFDSFQLDPRARVLLQRGRVVPLAPKVFEMLLVLVRNCGQVLSKDDLLDRVWPESIVEESNLTQSVYALRKALGARPDGESYIETIPRRGYRFAATVREIEQRDAGLGIRSLGVLPFSSLGAGSEEYLRLGVANALITRLSGIQQITVRPTSLMLKYIDRQDDLIIIGRELGVDSLLDGTIERAGDRIRVTVQLIGVADGAPLWAERFDEQFTNLLEVEDSISEQVTRALRIKLSGEEHRRMTRRSTENISAYQAYLKGRYFCERRAEDGLLKAIGFFEQAIAIDADFALAYSGLADAHFLLGVYRAHPPREVFPKAQAAAHYALALDPSLVEARSLLAYMRACYDWDWAGAEREFKQALALNPDYALARIWYSDYLSAVGRFDEALEEVQAALALDPLSLINNLNLALALYFARQYDQAIEQLERTLELDPHFALGHWSLGRAYRQQGRYDEAIEELRHAVALSGHSPLMVAALGRACAVAGRDGEARNILDSLREMALRRYVSPYDIATIHAGLGERDESFEWLDRAFEERSGRLFFLKVDPYWDGLRYEPQFKRLIARVGLTDGREMTEQTK